MCRHMFWRWGIFCVYAVYTNFSAENDEKKAEPEQRAWCILCILQVLDTSWAKLQSGWQKSTDLDQAKSRSEV